MPLKYIKDVYNTENPFVDILIYNLKVLAFSCVIKDQYEADQNETMSSIKASDLYIACIEKRADLYNFTYIPESILRKAGVPDLYIDRYTKKYYEVANTGNRQSYAYKSIDPDPYMYPAHFIPKEYHKSILDLLVPWYIENYDEENEYYRMITGLPPKGVQGVTIREFEYLIPDYLKESITDSHLYVHELGMEINTILEDEGILDVIRAEYPKFKYLKYLTQGIDIYTARLKNDMQIIWSTTDLNPAITNEFIDKYNKNRDFVLTTAYTKAMEIESDYYHSFMMMYTMLITFIDVLANTQSHIVKRDVLDRRCIKYILSMYDVPYFKIIPYKYQERLCRNVNKIVKYKSCDQGLLSIVNLFGFENLKIFKWFILKTRSLNSWGEFNYETEKKLVCSFNTVLQNESVTESLDTNTFNNNKPDYYDQISKYYNTSSEVEETRDTDRTIPFPFPYFLEKGNTMIVRLDDLILTKDQDYVLYDYNKIQFKNGIDAGKSSITYDFYYDLDTSSANFPADKDNAVTLYHTSDFTETDNPLEFDLSNNMEFSRFFISDKYQFNVILNGVWLTQGQYFVDYDSKIIKLSDSMTYDPLFDHIEFVFIQAKKFLGVYESKSVVISEEHIVSIPEPFENYISNGNEFFMMYNGNYVINYTQDGTTIVLDDSYEPDTSVQFYFFYSDKALNVDINLVETVDTIKTTEVYQTVYKTEFPISNYSDSGYKAYIKTLGWWIPETYYSIAGNDSIILQNNSIAPLDIGREFEIYLVYIPYDRTQYRSISTSSTFATAFRDFQKRFTISMPFPDYLNSSGKMIVDMEGIYLRKDDIENGYTIDNVTETTFDIIIENRDLRPMKGHRVNVSFYYFNETHDYQIGIEIKLLGILESDSQVFELEYPFYPYSETDHSMMVQVGQIVIPDSNIEIVDKFRFRFIGLDNKLYNEYLKDKSVTVLFFYSKYYKTDQYKKVQIESRSQPIESNQIELDTPANNFIENKWPFYVTKDGVLTTDFEVIDHTLFTTNEESGNLDIHYVYKLKPGFMGESYIETNIDENNELYFFRSELTDTSQVENSKDRSNWKTYENVTASDGWWNGLEFTNEGNEEIKKSIYEQKFNYERTKYYQLASIVNLSEFTSQIGFFSEMLYDDSLLEDKVDISVPVLSPTHRFKLSHLFIYMTALTYVFNGYEDIVIDSASKNLYVQGFNFTTDLEDLKLYLSKEHQHLSDFPIWNYITPTTDQENLVEFVNTYKTNYNVRQTIISKLAKANDYREYRLWKKIYNSLLITKNNYEFFKKADGNIATTYSEFLKDKDRILYNSLEEIKSISDQETLEDEIMTIIDYILYILDEYVKGPECKQVFAGLVTRDSSNARKFINILLDFFKSYKISLLSRSDTLNIGGSDSSSDPDAQFRSIDGISMNERSSYKSYMQPRIKIQTTEHCIFNEGIKIRKDPFAQLIENDLGNSFYARTHSNWIREDVRIEKRDKGTVYKYMDGIVRVNRIDTDINLPVSFDLINSTYHYSLPIETDLEKKQYESSLMTISNEIEKSMFDNEVLFINIDIGISAGLGESGTTITELYNELIAVIPEEDYGTLVVRIKKIIDDTGSIGSFFADSNIQIIPEEIKFVDEEGRFMSSNFENFSKDAKELTTVTIGGGICKNDGEEKNFSSMFEGCSNLIFVDKFKIEQPIIDKFENTNAGGVNLTRIFANCDKLQRGITSISTPQALDMTRAFDGCLSLTSAPKITCSFGNLNLLLAFFNCQSLTELPDIYFPEYDVTKVVGEQDSVPVIDMTQTFGLCTNLEKNVSNKNRGFIFTYCKPLLDKTFFHCESLLEAIPMSFNNKVIAELDETYDSCSNLINGGKYELSNTSKVIFKNTFKECSSLKNAGNIILNDFSTAILSHTYEDCYSLEDISNLFNSTEGWYELYDTFVGCSGLIDIEINMKRVSTINNIFSGCYMLERVIFNNVPSNMVDKLTHSNLDNDTLTYDIIIKEETQC